MRSATLCIVVPVFNEERRLPALLERLETVGDEVVSSAGLRLEQVVVVDDGSTDATADLLDGFAGLEGGRFRAIHFARNLGKGAAVREGMLAAESELALMTDVDLSTPLEDLAKLVAELDAGADIAIGSRAMSGSQVLVRQPIYRELMGKAFNVGVRILTRVPWRDTQCGFKLFRLDRTRRLFELQRVEGFAFDVELLVTARRLGLTIAEVPVRWVNSEDTRVGLFASSTRMAWDVLWIAYRARRPLPRRDGK